MNSFFRITTTPIELHQAFNFVTRPANGAVTSFVGMIRETNLGKSVLGVSYDVHEALAHHLFTELMQEVSQKWGDDLIVYVEHAKGKLLVGEVSIVITVGSKHRDEAFLTCRYLIETIKHRFPIWKQEHYIDGDSEWVKGHALCAH